MIFFPHWSEKLPPDVVDQYECVMFHMTDLPYGRGGSPLQNLIVRGHTETQMTAFRATNEIDAGPVYLKKPMKLMGTAETLFCVADVLISEMMMEILSTHPVPVPQSGPITAFVRRKPEASALPDGGRLAYLYDSIRMVDADGYPRAYLDHGYFHLEFSDAELHDEEVTARVRITRR